MLLSKKSKAKIIKNLINGKDYRGDIISLIDDLFLTYCIDFLKKVANAKMENKNITSNWYKKEFIDHNLTKQELAINSGLNMKTITNSYNSGRKDIVIEASEKNYDRLYNTINELIGSDEDLQITLTIKFRRVSVELTISESLIVINTLAVKRAEIRGGLWSSAGKQIEKPLMVVLCKLFNVPFEAFDQKNNPTSFREVDFYILSSSEKKLRCEVKLMGKGNPESADVIFAREPNIFIADKLSDKNKLQADKLGVQWLQLREENGYKKFSNILKKLKVNFKEPSEDINGKLDKVLKEIFIN
jgi:hypothetical protein